MVKEISDLVRKSQEIVSFYKEVVSNQNLNVPISSSITSNQLQNLSLILSSLDQKYLLL